MASSEGVSFRWEAFNRWCDEYADRHQGMKPKVEDVRRWHRENAERVWPDSSERPSVFLAVSHNKGRRVRGHKTCEYYKRYRAGKAAELQLAARLQPAALSGRRILAVTAAARKHATDQTRGASKRSSPDDDGVSERELQHIEKSEKRRRVRASAGPHATASSHPERGRAAARRASSEELSEDPSWASGAETSDDDSGSARGGPHAGLKGRVRSTTHHASVRSQPPHTGVHITVVHRDSIGRTIQVHTQPPHGPGLHSASSTLPPGSLFSGSDVPPSQPFLASHDSAAEGGAPRPRNSVFAGCPAYPGEVGSVCEGDALDDPEKAADQKRHRSHSGLRENCSSPPVQLQQQRPGSRDRELEADAWPNIGTARHPGVAPAHCRAARSSGTGQQPRPPRFSGYVETPVGSMPVYCVGGEGGRAAAAEARKAKGNQWRPATVVATDVVVGMKDPLDLLAQAACEALVASPGLAQEEDVEGQAAGGQGARKEEPEDGLRCWSGTSGGSGIRGTDRGGVGGNADGEVDDGRKKEGVRVKQETAGVEAGEKCDSGSRAAARVVGVAADNEGAEAKVEAVAAIATSASAASHSVSVSSQHSGEGVGSLTAKPAIMHVGATHPPAATEGSDLAAQSVLVKWPPSPLPQAAAALLPSDMGARLGSSGQCEGGATSSLLDLEAFVRAAAIAAAAQSTSSPACPAALPNHLTPALAPATTAAVAAALVPLCGSLSSGPLVTAPTDEPIYDAAGRAAANAAAVNAAAGMTMTAALLGGDQQQQQQSLLALNAAAPSSLSLPMPPPIDCILPTTTLQQQQQTHALLWPALAAAGGVAHPAPPAPFLGLAPPLMSDTASISLLGTQLLPMLRLLQMQMAARPDMMTVGHLGGDIGGLPPALLGLPPVAMPSAVDVGPVVGGSPPSQGRLGVGSQPPL